MNEWESVEMDNERGGGVWHFYLTDAKKEKRKTRRGIVFHDERIIHHQYTY